MRSTRTLFIVLLGFYSCFSFAQAGDLQDLQASGKLELAKGHRTLINKKLQTRESFQREAFIQQVGNRNMMVSRITSETSKLEVSQQGNDNYIHIIAHTRGLTENLTQNGNNNRIFDFLYGHNNDAGLHLIQEGNNSHFVRHGSNSIGNRMKLKMSGNSGSVIVRNFK